jgi:hypothetical protein
LNFRRNCGWTLERLGLFLVLLFFLAVSILMRTVTALVNEELIGASDLYVSVSTQAQTEIRYSGSRSEARAAMLKHRDLFHALAAEPGVIYCDSPLSYNPGFSFLSLSRPDPSESPYASPGQRSYVFQSSDAAIFRNRAHNIFDESAGTPEFAKRIVKFEHDMLFLSNTVIVSMNEPEFLRLHLQDQRLTEGRLPTEAELADGAAVCIIPAGLSRYADDAVIPLKVGDVLSVSCYLLDENYLTLNCETRELTVIGFYESADQEQRGSPGSGIYVPEAQFLSIYDWCGDFLEANTEADVPDAPDKYFAATQPMVFQFDRLDSLEAFIRRLENTPEYGAGSLQYFANVDDTVNMLSEFYGVAESFRSVSAIFGLLAAAFAVTLAVLDAFYRRRELAILQSIGESGGRLTLQFSLETLLLLILGWAAAIPAALRAVRAAIPGLLRQNAPAENPFATLSENIEMVTLDADRVCERLSYSRQDLIFFALFTLVTVLFCAAAVHICTRRFHVRTLLNH